jgi:hypothetical protein
MKHAPMKHVILILFWASIAASAADISGVWNLAYTTENGLRRESKLELKVDGDSLSGILSSERGRAPIEAGKISGDEMGFDLIRKSNNDEITVHFKGRIEGGAMKLTMQYGKRPPVAVVATKGT